MKSNTKSETLKRKWKKNTSFKNQNSFPFCDLKHKKAKKQLKAKIFLT